MMGELLSFDYFNFNFNFFEGGKKGCRFCREMKEEVQQKEGFFFFPLFSGGLIFMGLALSISLVSGFAGGE